MSDPSGAGFQQRLADSIRDGWRADGEVELNADILAGHCLTMIGEEVMRAMHRLAEEGATGSRDFGRGYSLAIKDVSQIIGSYLPGPAAEHGTC